MSATAERQCVVALRRANNVRLQQVAVKRAMKARTISLVEAWEMPEMQTMRISDCLEAVPGLAAYKVSSILLTLCIGYQRPLGNLSDGQRANILRLLRTRHPGIKAEA